jgi:ankyrin repeat protein
VHGADDDGFPYLTLAACYGYVQTVQALLSAAADPNRSARDGSTALQVAAQDGHVAVLELLVRCKARVNFQDQQNHVTALFLSCQEGQEESARFLLRAGADPHILRRGYSPLFVAVQEQHLGVVDALLVSRADANDASSAPGAVSCVLMATQLGAVPVLERLLKAKASANTPKADGGTPLLTAAGRGLADATRVLLRAGAAVGAVSADGRTALASYQELPSQGSACLPATAKETRPFASSHPPRGWRALCYLLLTRYLCWSRRGAEARWCVGASARCCATATLRSHGCGVVRECLDSHVCRRCRGAHDRALDALLSRARSSACPSTR